MPRHIFSALSVLLLLLGCACGPAFAEDELRVRRVALFLPGRTKITEDFCDKSSTKHVDYMFGSFLTAGNGVMVALAEAQYTEDGHSVVDIVAKYIDTEGANWANKTTENNGGNWKIKLAVQRKEEGIHYTTKSLGAVIKGNKIYLLALTFEMGDTTYHIYRWHLELFVGEFVSRGSGKMIEWKPSESLRSRLTQEIEGRVLGLFSLCIHPAFLTSKGTIVFGVAFMTGDLDSGFAILHLKDDEKQCEVSFITIPEFDFTSRFCEYFSFLEWKEKLIRIETGCSDGGHHVREYDEANKEWNDFSGTFFRPGHKLSKTRGFTTASIENVTVLLYTEAYANVTSSIGQWEIRLWVTDGSHFYDAGVIATEYAEVFSWGLVYTNGELFSLHQRTRGISGPIVFTHLDRQLKAIRSKMKLWYEESLYFSGPPLP